jgi:adenylate cyclase
MGAVVFLNVVGSTKLLLDAPRAGSDLLIAYLRSVANLATQVGALTVRISGDAVMAVFATPTEAVTFAGRAANRSPVTSGNGHRKAIEVRAGIATGEFALSPEVVGPTVNLAARLASLAEPGTIMCDQATRTLASRSRGRWRSTTKRPNLKGLPNVLPVYERSLRESEPKAARLRRSAKLPA